MTSKKFQALCVIYVVALPFWAYVAIGLSLWAYWLTPSSEPLSEVVRAFVCLTVAIGWLWICLLPISAVGEACDIIG